MVWYCLSPSKAGAMDMWLYTCTSIYIYNPWVSESSICSYTSLNYVGQGQFSLHSQKYFVRFSMSDGCFVCILRLLLYRRSVKPDLGCALHFVCSYMISQVLFIDHSFYHVILDYFNTEVSWQLLVWWTVWLLSVL